MNEPAPIVIDLGDTLDEAWQPWMCPQCRRVCQPPLTTYISPMDGLERCAACAGQHNGCATTSSYCGNWQAQVDADIEGLHRDPDLERFCAEMEAAGIEPREQIKRIKAYARSRREKIKCARTICRRGTVTPEKRGWLWIEIEPGPPKTGWYCPACAEELQHVLAEQGVTPTIERLN